MASTSCAACDFLRRGCEPECVFEPYFLADQLLNRLHPSRREDAVSSLAFEADARLKDPMCSCTGIVSILQDQLRQVGMDLSYAKSEISKYQNIARAAIGDKSPEY